jgi:hypothetical protein
MLAFHGLSVLLATSAIVGLRNLLVIVGQQAFVAHVSQTTHPTAHAGRWQPLLPQVNSSARRP